MACVCGSRPKKNAPPMSILRYQDVALPLFNFGGNPFNFPGTPPLFSVLWIDATSSFCARNPDRLYLEFPPYRAGVLTSALKKLWSRNCECKPVRGTWRVTFNYKITSCSNFGGCGESKPVVNSTVSGAYLSLRRVYTTNGKVANWDWYAFTAANGYSSEVRVGGQSISSDYGAEIESTFSQVLIASGCFTPANPEPVPPPYPLPIPHIPTPVPPIIPVVILPPVIPPKPPPPPPPECCDCC